MSGQSPARAFGGLLTSRAFWAGYGALMAVIGSGLPVWAWPPDGNRIFLLSFCALVFAVLAQPYTGRPVLAAVRFHAVALAHRNTVLVGAFVVLVACERVPAWLGGVDAVLLAGYLLLTDVLTVPPAVLRRLAAPPFLLALAALVGAATALVALPAASGTYRPVLAAAAAAAGLGAAVATAFGSAGGRRVGSAGTEHRNQDRSSE